MSAQSRPTFFCSRPNGALTPMIAVDDLPSHVVVRGVPRSLSVEETQGMTSCGMLLSRSEPYVVDGPAGTQVSLHALAHKRLADELKAVLTNVVCDMDVPPHHRQAVGAVLTAAMETPYFLNTGTNGNEAATASGNAMNTALVPVNSTDNALVPAQGPVQSHDVQFHGNSRGPRGRGKNNGTPKKSFCSYWIRHGECDYQQQGCMYKHEMPVDQELLNTLGLRDIPRWYRDKYGMTSILGHPTLGQLANTPVNASAGEPSGFNGRAIEWSRNDQNQFNQFNQADQAGHPSRGNGRWRGSRGGGHGGRGRNTNWNRNAHHRHTGHHQNTNWSDMPSVPRAFFPGPAARGPVSHAPVGPPPVSRGPVAPGVAFPGPVAPGFGVSGPVHSGPVHTGPVAPGHVAPGHVAPGPVAPGPVAPVAQQSTTDDWNQATPTRKNPVGTDSIISVSTDTSFSAAQGNSTWDFLTAGLGSDARPDNAQRGFRFGQDGNELEDSGPANPSLSALSHLVAESDPIGPNELLLSFGAIGGPVKRPASGQSAGGVPVSAGPETAQKPAKL